MTYPIARAALTALMLTSVLMASKCAEEGWQHEGTKTYHPGKPGPRGAVKSHD
jgi:hypothetical protein